MSSLFLCVKDLGNKIANKVGADWLQEVQIEDKQEEKGVWRLFLMGFEIIVELSHKHTGTLQTHRLWHVSYS